MPLPDVLASEIDALRSIVRTADTISARYQGGNALRCLEHLRDYVEPDTQTDEALEAVANRCGALMDEITFRAPSHALATRPLMTRAKGRLPRSMILRN